jgi:membrane peptidoglycan carboxypeptidase
MATQTWVDFSPTPTSRHSAWVSWNWRLSRRLLLRWLVLLSCIAIAVPSLSLLANAFFRDPPLPQAEARWAVRSADAVLLAPEHAPLDVAELPPYVPDAFIAAEDHAFRRHWGIRLEDVAVQLVHWLPGSAWEEKGVSTITMQLARGGRREGRPAALEEAYNALWAELRWSKDEILRRYLEHVFLGGDAHGVQAASRRYFGKDARALTLGEAALLAGIVPAPSAWNPRKSPGAARRERDRVLDKMVAQGLITPEEVAKARREKLRLPSPASSPTRWFVEHAQAEAAATRLKQGRVLTGTLDSRLQDASYAAVRRRLAERPASRGGHAEHRRRDPGHDRRPRRAERLQPRGRRAPAYRVGAKGHNSGDCGPARHPPQHAGERRSDDARRSPAPRLPGRAAAL